MSLCNFDHITKIAARTSRMRSTVCIDQVSDAPMRKVWVQPMATNVTGSDARDEALANKIQRNGSKGSDSTKRGVARSTVHTDLGK
jgi:hypothetical protein